jgi:hypothetical protein
MATVTAPWNGQRQFTGLQIMMGNAMMGGGRLPLEGLRRRLGDRGSIRCKASGRRRRRRTVMEVARGCRSRNRSRHEHQGEYCGHIFGEAVMEDSWERRRRLLTRERKWLAAFVPTPPALQGADLKRGLRYFVVMDHDEKCWLRRVGWKCTCRPTTRFFAA